MNTTIVTSATEWDRHAAAWDALLDGCANPSVTLTWPWLRTWWDVFGVTGRELRVVLVEQDGVLVGAAPLLRRTQARTHYRVLPMRRLELLASGEERGSPICSDYIGWPVRAGAEHAVASAVFDTLMGELAGEWDELILPDMHEESPMVAAILETARARRLSAAVLAREPAAVLDLAPTWEGTLERLGSGLRYKIRRGRRDFEGQGGEYHVVGPGGDWEAAFETLVDLHQARWTAKGKPGAFKHPRRQQFHRQVIPRLLSAGHMRLGVLQLPDGPLGAIYNTLYRGQVFFYQSGMRLTAQTHLRPGVLLHGYEMDSAIQGGAHEYDFLKRGHSEYKDSWTSRSRHLVRVRIGTRGFKDRSYHFLTAGVDQARRFKRRMEKLRAGQASGRTRSA